MEESFLIETDGARIDEVTSLLLDPKDSGTRLSRWAIAPKRVLRGATGIWRTIIRRLRVGGKHRKTVAASYGSQPGPGRALVRGHVALLHRCALEFNSQPHSNPENQSPIFVQTGILVNTLFDRYFTTTYGGEPVAGPEPLFDFLLEVLDLDQDLTSALTSDDKLGVVSTIALVFMPPSCGMEDSPHFLRFTVELLGELRAIWDAKKQRRLLVQSVSPLPWSTSARDPETTVSVAMQFERTDADAVYETACQESGIPRSSVDFLHVPPMRWLGCRGTHDGYPNFVSVQSYVAARYKTGLSMLEHVALWQSALTFGVLEAITGFIIPESWFLSTDEDGTITFASHHAAALAFSFGLRLYNEPDGARRQLLADHALDTVEWACKALSEELFFPPSSLRSMFWSTGITDGDVNDMMCSTYSLLVIFRLVLIQIKVTRTAGDFSPYRFASPDDYQTLIARTHLSYTHQMLENGWCPYTVMKLRRTDSELAILAGILDMKRPSFRHHPNEHAACTEESCSVHNVNPATYTTQHTTATCSCLFLAPSLPDVDSMLSAEVIPVVTYDGRQLSIRRASDGPYIAISHVWADGLGSTTERGLPTCQIARIAAFARKLVPHGAFWIDGLCVPDVKHLRKAAIRLMAKTYRGAERVIVLDAGIRAHCALSNKPAENVLRVKTSVWMQRVWTMHEAFLARELYFEFSDGLVAGSAIRQGLDASALPDHLSWWWRLVEVFLDSTILDPNNGEQDRRFVDVARMVAFCDTSKSEDAPVAVAGMMDMDVAGLLEEPDADARMRKLLLEMKTVWVDMIFTRPMTAQEAERLPYPGFRWAPRSITALCNNAGGRGSTALCTPDGLTTKDMFAVVLLERKHYRHAEPGSDTDSSADPRLFFVSGLLQGGRFLMLKLIPRGPRPFDCFEAGEFNALIVRDDWRDWQELGKPTHGLSSVKPELVLPGLDQSVDVLAVYIPHPDRIPNPSDSESLRGRPVVCEYRFMTQLWHPAVVQAASPEDLARELGPRTSYVCPLGRLVQARITLT